MSTSRLAAAAVFPCYAASGQTAVNATSQNIAALSEKFDNRSRLQCKLIVGLLGLVVTIPSLVFDGWKAPLYSTIQCQDYDLR